MKSFAELKADGFRLFDAMKDSIGMMDAGRIINIAHLTMQTQELSGDVVEMGCWQGHTALVMSLCTGKLVHVYDSLEGLPDKEPVDGDSAAFVKGSCSALKADVLGTFEKAGVRAPMIHQGWFGLLKPEDMPKRIAFAHIDCDLHGSILAALGLVYPRLVPGAICVIDDYGWGPLPGAKLGTDQFMADKPERLVKMMGPKMEDCWQVYFRKFGIEP